MNLSSDICSLLIGKKLLLAFSGGVDSSALFYLLLKVGLKPDLAIVDYGIREQSKDEVIYAKELAQKYGCSCHVAKSPKFESHFEQNARNFRYEFFEDIIIKEGYEVLLTAHQLNDQLEWFLMRLTKGAGVSELVGLQNVTQKSNYHIVRPLLEFGKQDLQEYLDANNYCYFIDESNSDESYERNSFRKHYSDSLIEKYKDGIRRSFEYLRNDISMLKAGFETIFAKSELRIIKLHDIRLKTKAADITLKELGYLLSAKQRDEIKENNSVVIGGSWVVAIYDDMLFIAPYVKVVLAKEFKESCRIKRIPPLIRGYIYDKNINLEEMINGI